MYDNVICEILENDSGFVSAIGKPAHNTAMFHVSNMMLVNKQFKRHAERIAEKYILLYMKDVQYVQIPRNITCSLCACMRKNMAAIATHDAIHPVIHMVSTVKGRDLQCLVDDTMSEYISYFIDHRQLHVLLCMIHVFGFTRINRIMIRSDNSADTYKDMFVLFRHESHTKQYLKHIIVHFYKLRELLQNHREYNMPFPLLVLIDTEEDESADSTDAVNSIMVHTNSMHHDALQFLRMSMHMGLLQDSIQCRTVYEYIFNAMAFVNMHSLQALDILRCMHVVILATHRKKMDLYEQCITGLYSMRVNTKTLISCIEPHAVREQWRIIVLTLLKQTAGGISDATKNVLRLICTEPNVDNRMLRMIAGRIFNAITPDTQNITKLVVEPLLYLFQINMEKYTTHMVLRCITRSVRTMFEHKHAVRLLDTYIFFMDKTESGVFKDNHKTYKAMLACASHVADMIIMQNVFEYDAMLLTYSFDFLLQALRLARDDRKYESGLFRVMHISALVSWIEMFFVNINPIPILARLVVEFLSRHVVLHSKQHKNGIMHDPNTLVALFESCDYITTVPTDFGAMDMFLLVVRHEQQYASVNSMLFARIHPQMVNMSNINLVCEILDIELRRCHTTDFRVEHTVVLFTHIAQHLASFLHASTLQVFEMMHAILQAYAKSPIDDQDFMFPYIKSTMHVFVRQLLDDLTYASYDTLHSLMRMLLLCDVFAGHEHTLLFDFCHFLTNYDPVFFECDIQFFVLQLINMCTREMKILCPTQRTTKIACYIRQFFVLKHVYEHASANVLEQMFLNGLTNTVALHACVSMQ